MQDGRSDSPIKCGLCNGEAYVPARFGHEDAIQMDGMFNVCPSAVRR